MKTLVMNRPERLQFARKRAGLEQAQMAEILGVNRATVSDYENGKSDMNVSRLVKWAVATETSVEWLSAAELEYAPRDSNPEPTDFGLDDELAFWAIVEPVEVLR